MLPEYRLNSRLSEARWPVGCKIIFSPERPTGLLELLLFSMPMSRSIVISFDAPVAYLSSLFKVSMTTRLYV